MNLKEYIFGLGRLFHKNHKASKVIFYHDVTGVRGSFTSMATVMSLFKQHIEIIRQEGFAIVPEITKSEGQIQICFDDGFRGIWEQRDYFIKHNIFPTIFFAIDLIGKQGYLIEEEILHLQDAGFRFESHAYSHTDLSTFDEKDLRFELFESKSALEKLLSKPVKEICFPIGYFSDQVCELAREAGYEKLYSSIPGDYYAKNKEGVIYRYLTQFSTKKEFRQIINGGMSFLKSHYYKRHKR